MSFGLAPLQFFSFASTGLAARLRILGPSGTSEGTARVGALAFLPRCITGRQSAMLTPVSLAAFSDWLRDLRRHFLGVTLCSYPANYPASMLGSMLGACWSVLLVIKVATRAPCGICEAFVWPRLLYSDTRCDDAGPSSRTFLNAAHSIERRAAPVMIEYRPRPPWRHGRFVLDRRGEVHSPSEVHPEWADASSGRLTARPQNRSCPCAERAFQPKGDGIEQH
jgi:hypothetical protein